MKVVGIIVKIVLALAAVAGIVYLAATYGDRVVAWAKKLLKGNKCCCETEGECVCEDGECTCGECECDDEDVTVEVVEAEPVASETDFEG